MDPTSSKVGTFGDGPPDDPVPGGLLASALTFEDTLTAAVATLVVRPVADLDSAQNRDLRGWPAIARVERGKPQVPNSVSDRRPSWPECGIVRASRGIVGTTSAVLATSAQSGRMTLKSLDGSPGPGSASRRLGRDRVMALSTIPASALTFARPRGSRTSHFSGPSQGWSIERSKQFTKRRWEEYFSQFLRPGLGFTSHNQTPRRRRRPPGDMSDRCGSKQHGPSNAGHIQVGL